jgi:hypothetical protein
VGGLVYSVTFGNIAYDIDEDGEPVILGRYGICSEVPDVIYLFSINLPWLYTTPEDIMAHMFLMPYIYSLSELTVYTPERQLNFTITGDAFQNTITHNGVILTNTRPFTELYQYIISAKGEIMFRDELEPDCELIARITYRYREDSREDDVVEFYTAGDRKSIIRINGENVYMCRDIYTIQLLSNIEAFINGDELRLDW